MKKVNENLDYLKYKKVDPYGEEDWSEYEIKKDDVFYLFFYDSNNENVYLGIGSSEFKGEKIYIRIIKSDNIDIVGESVPLSDGIVDTINKNQYSVNKFNFKKFKVITIVNDFRLKDKYNNIHESIRKYLYDIVKKTKNEIVELENELDKLETNVISLKKYVKTGDEVPNKDDIVLGENEYILFKTTKNSVGGSDLKVGIYTVSKPDKEKGRHFVNKEDGSKGLRIGDDAYKKLLSQKYLLLRSKNDSNNATYVIGDLELYDEMVEYIITTINDNLKKKIEDKRKKYREIMKTVQEKRDILKEKREKYLTFSFSEIIKNLKNL